MQCPNTEELMDYTLEECSSPKRREIEAHCLACPECGHKLQTLKQTLSAAASVRPAPVSEGFTARLMEGLEGQNAAAQPSIPVRLFFRPAWGLALAACSILLILSTAYFAGHRNSPGDPMQTFVFSDGPATFNNSFSAAENPAAAADVPVTKKPGYIYADTCSAVKCGIL
jgi:hypothetical protein